MVMAALAAVAGMVAEKVMLMQLLVAVDPVMSIRRIRRKIIRMAAS